MSQAKLLKRIDALEALGTQVKIVANGLRNTEGVSTPSNILNETWFPVKGFPGYMISNKGEVKSLRRFAGTRWYKEIIMSGTLLNGYKQVRLSNQNQKITAKIHRLVAIHFIANPLNLSDVNHLDGNKSNNAVENLEWCTKKQNCEHASKLGLLGNVRKVRDLDTGSVYNSITAAAKAKGLRKGTLWSYLNGVNNNKTSLIYE